MTPLASIPADEAFSRMRADGDEDSVASFRKRLHFVGADGALGWTLMLPTPRMARMSSSRRSRGETVGRNAVAHHAAQVLLFFIELHRVPHEREEIGTGETGGAAPMTAIVRPVSG